MVLLDGSIKSEKCLDVALKLRKPTDKIYTYHLKENNDATEKINRLMKKHEE